MNQSKIPEGWAEKSLSEMTELVKGITYKSSDYCEQGQGAIFINLKCISKSGGFKKEGLKFYKGPIKNKQILEYKDIIIAAADLTREGDIIGYPLFVPKFGVNQTVTMSMDVAKLRPKNEAIDKLFLFYRLCMNDAHMHMRANSGGSTVLHLNLKKVGQMKFNVPKMLQEQQKIANILLTIDNTIDKTKELIEKNKKIKQGLMQDLFEKGAFNSENINSVFGLIPKSWKIQSFYSLAANKAEVVQTGPFGAQLHASDYVEEGVPLILIRNVVGGRIDDTEIPFITEKKAATLPRYILKEGDVVFSRVADVGRAAVVTDKEKGWMISGQMLRLRLNNPNVNMRYIKHFIASNKFKREMEYRILGTTRDSINTTILKNMIVAIPKISEQNKIAEYLDKIDEKIESEESYLQKLLKIKAGLMQDLLTGKIRVGA